MKNGSNPDRQTCTIQNTILKAQSDERCGEGRTAGTAIPQQRIGSYQIDECRCCPDNIWPNKDVQNCSPKNILTVAVINVFSKILATCVNLPSASCCIGVTARNKSKSARNIFASAHNQLYETRSVTVSKGPDYECAAQIVFTLWRDGCDCRDVGHIASGTSPGNQFGQYHRWYCGGPTWKQRRPWKWSSRGYGCGGYRRGACRREC